MKLYLELLRLWSAKLKRFFNVRQEYLSSSGENTEILQLQITKLEEELREAQEKKERALSMAQQTKRGHVYIISNIGAFGESVYKIGMTRRLEPIDRIRELGDASVPFHFLALVLQIEL